MKHSRLLRALPPVLAALPAAHRLLLRREACALSPPGALVSVGGHALHVYAEGEGPGPVLVFLSGGGTPAPVYDFRPLYRLLSAAHRVAVVEKPGYGYAPSARCPRDVDTLVRETREALRRAGFPPPYVLLPHSYSGLEALCWAARYPTEIAALVGLDMAVPEVYARRSVPPALFSLLGAAGWLGAGRLPPLRPGARACLSPEERRQERLLFSRSLYSPCVVAEARAAWDNARRTAKLPMPSCPMLLFVSDGREIGPFWRPCQEEFIRAAGARGVFLDCGHYVHQHRPAEIAAAVLPFLAQITESKECPL